MVKGIIFDLDGTLYWNWTPIPGGAEFVEYIRGLGLRPLFVTNRANRAGFEIRDQLKKFGIECSTEDILTSTQATIEYLGSGSAYLVGERQFRAEFEEAGFEITEENPDYVVVSFDRTFDYDKLTKACTLIDKGAKFIATNPDQCLKVEDGVLPGTGAIVAAVEAGCGGIKPVCVGKPEKLILEMGLKILDMDSSEVIAIGDNINTDILAGEAAGIRTVLLLTGISTRSDLDSSDIKPTWVAEDFEALKKIIAQEVL